MAQFNKWGRWGLKEHNYETATPKYLQAKSFVRDNWQAQGTGPAVGLGIVAVTMARLFRFEKEVFATPV